MGYGTVEKSSDLDEHQYVRPEGRRAVESRPFSRPSEGRVLELQEYRQSTRTLAERKWTRFLKRSFDIVLGSIMLIFFAPVIFVFAALVRLQDGQKAVFSQERYGLDGKVFRCFKLRSMVPDAGTRLTEILASDPQLQQEWDETQKLVKDPRITSLGHLLRKTSIDELPQLINVLRGDMSLIGPRPIVKNEIERYGNSYHDYTSVRPGITGLWQIGGRSNTTYDERVAMDVKYARTLSFWGDIKICLMTVPVLLFRKGAH